MYRTAGVLTPYSLEAGPKKKTALGAASGSPTGELDDLYGEEEGDEEEEATTGVGDDAMIKVKDKSKKGPGKTNKNDSHTKKKEPKTSNKRK